MLYPPYHSVGWIIASTKIRGPTSITATIRLQRTNSNNVALSVQNGIIANKIGATTIIKRAVIAIAIKKIVSIRPQVCVGC